MKPTHLYVKIHKVTGLKYFGKTTRDPFSYRGSGKYWLRHLRTHGNFVSTYIIGTYEDPEELMQIALSFSLENSIVESPSWANLMPEIGIDGRPEGLPGHVFSVEERMDMSSKLVERWTDPAYREKMRQTHIRRYEKNPERADLHRQWLTKVFWTPERREEHSMKMKEKWKDPDFRSNYPSLKGIPKPPSHGPKVSKALTGRKKSEAHKRALSESTVNRRPSKLPPEVDFLSSGVYSYRNIGFSRVKRGQWEADLEGRPHTYSIRSMMETIDNYLKQKD